MPKSSKDDGREKSSQRESKSEGKYNSKNDSESKDRTENNSEGTDETENDSEGKDKIENDLGVNEEKKKKFPMAVVFILGNEFCERFSFYGMRTILTLYLNQELKFSERSATILYHTFVLIAYFTPLFGAIIADAWLGRFKTIFYISLIYGVGNFVVAVGSIPSHLLAMRIVSMVGLLIIGFGTGGIKPCVSAFGGDQFREDQVKERRHFFSMFYFVINSGSVISTLLTPILREDVQCFGQKTCYVLAFSVPAFLMVISVILFVIGRPLYIMMPVKGSVLISVFKCIGHALSRKMRSKGEKKDHWLDYAEDTYDKKLICEIKTLVKVLVLFLPLPVFWCLFEQTSSTWVLQATKMDGKFLGYVIEPDQMQALNPLFILIFIPVFDYLIYPLFNKFNLLTKPLQRMTVGGLLAALAFLIAGFLELEVEDAIPIHPKKGLSELRIINNSPCQISMTGPQGATVGAFVSKVIKDLTLGGDVSWTLAPTGCTATASITKSIHSSSSLEMMMITVSNKALYAEKSYDIKMKEKRGESRIRILFSTDFEFKQGDNASFELVGENNLKISPENVTTSTKVGMTQYYTTAPGTYKVHVPYNSEAPREDTLVGEAEFMSGGTYIAAIYDNAEEKQKKLTIFETVKHNSVSMLWQIPGNIIVTAGEILFSITGLEFAYSQAPDHMKSLVQAAWLMTSAFGQLLMIILKTLNMFGKQSVEFFMFSIVMALDMLLFGIMAYYYKYVVHTTSPENEESLKNEKSPEREDYPGSDKAKGTLSVGRFS